MARLTYCPNMAMAVYRGRKAKKTNNTQQSNAFQKYVIRLIYKSARARINLQLSDEIQYTYLFIYLFSPLF